MSWALVHIQTNQKCRSTGLMGASSNGMGALAGGQTDALAISHTTTISMQPAAMKCTG